MSVVIETHTVAICSDANVDGEQLPLIEALHNFAKSRATKLLIRRGKESDVCCELRVPLLREGNVRPDELGRAIRKVWRAAIDAAEPGNKFVIEFRAGPDSQLVVQAERSA
jgi:hypothetical protein